MTSDNEALVSIVFPTLNAERYLQQALDSCLSQTYGSVEVLVVDGGSTDGTLDILRACADPRVEVLQQPANSGKLPGALNLGFSRSSGAYLTWMQADDLYELDAIESMVQYLMENPRTDFVYCDYWWIDDEGQRLRTVEVNPSEHLRRYNPVGQCFLYRRCVYEDVGEYDPSFYMAEDYEYWIRVSRTHRMDRLQRKLYAHRWNDNALTVKEYGRFLAARIGASARRKWFHTSWNEYRRDVASAHIEEAFARYGDRDLSGSRRSLLRGVMLNPLWLSNRGVVSVLVQSLLGDRSRTRRLRLLANRSKGKPTESAIYGGDPR